MPPARRKPWRDHLQVPRNIGSVIQGPGEKWKLLTTLLPEVTGAAAAADIMSLALVLLLAADAVTERGAA